MCHAVQASFVVIPIAGITPGAALEEILGRASERVGTTDELT
jgi:hypothetical protein